MKKSLNLAGAFVGVIVGAGFGSGQEVMQFFTNYGLYSLPAILIALLLFSFIGMQIAQLGSHISSTSHKQIINLICGRYLGTAVDVILSFFLFGVAVIMIAGAGTLVEQQFGLPPIYGTIGMTAITILTLLLNVDKIINIISAFTPILLVMMIIVCGYSIFTNDLSTAEIIEFAQVENAVSSSWIIGALLYVSFNIAVGFSMLSVIGGTLKNKKQAALGGLIGGVLLGILLLLINIGMMADLKNVHNVDMPTLHLANQLSPLFGNLLSIILLAMIYNTCVGMFYAFTARFVPKESKYFNLSVTVVGIAGFASSFVGFASLVGTVYPIMGYVGFILLGGVILSWFRSLHHSPKEIRTSSTDEREKDIS